MQQNNIDIVPKTNRMQPYITMTGIFIYKVTRNLDSRMYTFRVAVRYIDRKTRPFFINLDEKCRLVSFNDSKVVLNSLGTKI